MKFLTILFFFLFVYSSCGTRQDSGIKKYNMNNYENINTQNDSSNSSDKVKSIFIDNKNPQNNNAVENIEDSHTKYYQKDNKDENLNLNTNLENTKCCTSCSSCSKEVDNKESKPVNLNNFITNEKVFDIQDKNNAYFIQIGSFSSQKNADYVLENIKQDFKLSNIYIIDSNNTFKVRVGPYKDREEASVVLKKFRTSKYKDSFLVFE